MSIEVRPFQRGDRDQVTALVNAHIQAVVPGMSVSVNAVLSQLEREPGEFIVDPWVAERATLVAVERDRVVAAALLHRSASSRSRATTRAAARSHGSPGGADVGNLRVEEPYRRRGVATWLLGQAAAWLRLGGVARLLSYTTPDEEESLAFHAHAGFRELARTRRGWTRSTMGA